MKIAFPISGFEFESEEEDVTIIAGGLTVRLAQDDGEVRVDGSDGKGNVLFTQRFQQEAD